MSCIVLAQQGLSVGAQAPDFSALDHNGKIIRLKELIKTGPVVLVFYRGSWCPNCMRALRNLEDSLSLITARNATVVAVSPGTAEGIKKTQRSSHASFSLISDEGLRILRLYDVAFQLTPDMEKVHQQYNIDVKGNNGKNGDILPRPAAYVIDKTGVIIYRYFNTESYSSPNSNSRVQVKEILKSLN